MQKTIQTLIETLTFVKIREKDVSPDIAEEARALLLAAIECARKDDADCVRRCLDALDALKIPGWDLTSRTREVFPN